MRFVLRHTLPTVTALICCTAQSAWASPTVQDPGSAPRIGYMTSDPVQEVSLAPATEKQLNAVMTRAAGAARRDLDPDVNGSIKDIRQAPCEANKPARKTKVRAYP